MRRLVTSLAHVFCAAALCVACGGAAAEGAQDPGSLEDPIESISAEELFRRGRLLVGAGDYIRAEQYIAAAMQRGYPEEEAMPALMAACVEGSRLIAALQYAEPYLAQHPDHWSLRMLVASIHMGLDHHTRARNELETVVRTAPEDETQQAHYFLGVLYRDRLDDAELSAEHFRQYLALAPEGTHREEALAGLPRAADARPLPRRVPMPEPHGEAGATEAGASEEGASEAGASEEGASEEGASEEGASQEGPAS